jgi:hypothetical protein
LRDAQIVGFPNAELPLDRKNEDHEAFQDGYVMRRTRMPAVHASKLLSAAFWDDATIARKSDNHFHWTPLIIHDTPYDPTRTIHWRPAKIDPNLPEEGGPGDEETLEAVCNLPRVTFFFFPLFCLLLGEAVVY